MPTIDSPETVWANGVLVETIHHQLEISQAEANQLALLDKARLALAGNAAFIAIASPTNPQVVAQVRLLTRENSALIRLLISALDDISDT